MKLQKLVYYSQAWWLAHRGVPLFDEPIEAWAHGPVVYALFDRHRGQFIVGPTWPPGDSSRLTGEERVHVGSVVHCYGEKSAAELSELTHAEQPWQQARAGLGPRERASAVISHGAMQDFYGAQLRRASAAR
ncbi:MAG TPA: type II toxin-antitoxin system antitoxin SocA domain-containing protein [Anaeromyxobacteraceae bacterium]|nr:type II toxin-antitoxin system antitoxin SocA domain-containing protein [Anaeromyxobacteraceae bacterium]